MNYGMRGYLILGILLASFSVSGQNNGFYLNHYMFNQAYYNPAWVGVEGEAFATGHHRSQWLGYSSSFDGSGGAPSTQMVSLIVPIEGKFQGAGVAVSNDRVGEIINLQVRFSISAQKEFNFGTLSAGLMPSLYSQTLDFSQLRAVEFEPLLQRGRESQLTPDLGAGLYLESNRNYFIGISAINLLEPTFDYGTGGESLSNSTPTSVIITGGTRMGLTRDLEFTPNAFVQTDFKSYSFDLSAILTYQDKIWGGLSFKRSESVTLLMGYSFMENNRLKFGYSFDYVVKDREAKQPTSHEIYIRYDLPDLRIGGKKVVTTPRFNIRGN